MDMNGQVEIGSVAYATCCYVNQSIPSHVVMWTDCLGHSIPRRETGTKHALDCHCCCALLERRVYVCECMW